jgi:hypothetical protein
MQAVCHAGLEEAFGRKKACCSAMKSRKREPVSSARRAPLQLHVPDDIGPTVSTPCGEKVKRIG